MRHYFSVSDPMALTVKRWDALMEAYGYLRAMEHGDERSIGDARSDRADYLRRVRGW